MKVTVVNRFESRLPSPDPHPYRGGAWTPNTIELDAEDLDVIAGEIPADLAGVYLRNSENPLFEAIRGRYHPFDGDGMVHAIAFSGGRARYRNRFVRTAGFVAEQAAGRALWAGILEPPEASEREGWGARTAMKDASSTDVIVHRGEALTTFYQCGDAYRLDPFTLETRGTLPLAELLAASGEAGALPRGAAISAHPKVDEATGELLFFNYSKEPPFLHLGIVGPDGRLSRYVPVPLPGPRLPHDMAFTEHFAILNDFPMLWDPALLSQGVHRPRYRPELGSRFALVPRREGGPIRWFDAAPTYVLHFSNAYEEGDEVVLEGFFQDAPVPARRPDDTPLSAFLKSVDMNAMEARLHRWRFDLRTGLTREERLDDEICEFPTIDARFAGRKQGTIIAMTGAPGLFVFDGMVRYDLARGTKQRHRFPPGVYGSEAPVAPRLGAAGEGDGYVVTFVSDLPNDASEAQIFDAGDLARGPLARVRLPQRICSGTHATWAAASQPPPPP